ncbi:MAG: hypothetical protein JXX28_01730 [Deltaproteobacteria bacterium]|nr:hypothetical protein [Deltaproteobacteria bacterium]
MRELRRDPTTGDWVALVPGRPLPRRERGVPLGAEGCPFCPGAEEHTGAEISRRQGAGSWSVRVIPEQSPALRPEVQAGRRGFGPYDQVAGVGAHEVIVESPEHRPLWDQPLTQSIAALEVAQARLRDLARDGRFAHITWTRSAGGCCEHPRARVVAMPVVPRALSEAQARAAEWLARTGRELFQDLVDYEREDGRRVLLEEDGIIALCPWSSRVPFEVWVLPAEPGASFAGASQRLVGAAARVLRWVEGRLAQELDGVSVQVQLWTEPLRSPGGRWHFRVLPALEQAEGGISLNPVPPEEAARVLRR